MKLKYLLFILIGLAISVTIGSKTTFAANGLFGPIISQQMTPIYTTWTVPPGVHYVHITATGGGNFFGVNSAGDAALITNDYESCDNGNLWCNEGINAHINVGNRIGTQEVDYTD